MPVFYKCLHIWTSCCQDTQSFASPCPRKNPSLNSTKYFLLKQSKSRSWSFSRSSLPIALIDQESANHPCTPGTTQHAVAATVFFLDTATISFLAQLSDHSASVEETWAWACHHHATASLREFNCTLFICKETLPSLWSIHCSPFPSLELLHWPGMKALTLLLRGDRNTWTQVPTLCIAKAFWMRYSLEALSCSWFLA